MVCLIDYSKRIVVTVGAGKESLGVFWVLLAQHREGGLRTLQAFYTVTKMVILILVEKFRKTKGT